MKNTKIMAVLVVLLAAMLFVGAASAATAQTLTLLPSDVDVGDTDDITVTLTLNTAADADMTYTITDNDGEEYDDLAIEETETTGTITIVGYTRDTAGDVTFTATNKVLGSDTATATLTVVDPDAPTIALVADPDTVVEGQTFIVTVTGDGYVDETVTVTVSYEGIQSGDVELNADNSYEETIEFTAVLNEQTISATSDDLTEIDDIEITVTAAVGSEINVNVSAPGAELLSGTFILIDEGAGKVRLPAGVIFTTSAGDKITTEVGGQITIDDEVASGLYQNLSKGYNFTVKTGTPSGFFLLGDDSVIADDEYTLTITASGDAYIGETATIYFGDDTPEVTIDSLDATQDVTHKYAAEGIYTINVTVGDESKYKDVSVADGGRIVDAATHGSAFVYETVRVENDGTAVPKLYFFSSDATPTLIATM
ncbi:hypothetical protein, partial [Methanorbis furvi]|uniref:hypothetical protein n=1 Tax=Methanorbis furvi TaxID=3028299 RepID=UPI0030B8C2F2